MAKLNAVDYEGYKDNMLHRMWTFNIPFEKVSRYIDEDLDDVKQAKRMKKAIRGEYREMQKDELDALLSEVMDVLQMPEKWALDNTGKLVNIYPHPVIKDRKVVGVEYKTNKSYLFEDEDLYNRYIVSQRTKKPKKPKKAKPSMHYLRNYPVELLEEWIALRNEGKTYPEIAERYGTTRKIVEYQIKKYKKKGQQS